MKRTVLIGFGAAIILMAAPAAPAEIIHDGAQTSGLDIFASTGAAESNGSYLTLASLDHAAWYATGAGDRPDSVNYTLSATARAGDGGRYGAIGLIDLDDENSGVAVLFKPTEGFRVECGLDAFGVTGLHNSDGTASASTDDTRLATPGGFDQEAWATFTLVFAAASQSQADNMTARGRTALAQVTATVTQGLNEWALGTFVIENAASSPDGKGVSLPDAANHRVGFYVRGAAQQYNADFDNLTLNTPEPATCGLLLAGAGAMAVQRRRRRRR